MNDMLQIYFDDLLEQIEILATQLEIQKDEIQHSLGNYKNRDNGVISYENFFNIVNFILDSQVSKQVAGQFFQEMTLSEKEFSKDINKIKEQNLDEKNMEQEQMVYNDDLFEYIQQQNDDDEDEEVRKMIINEIQNQNNNIEDFEKSNLNIPFALSLIQDQPHHQETRFTKEELDSMIQQSQMNGEMKKTGHTQMTVSIAEKRKANLKEIYEFYCKQTYVQGKHATFDRLKFESTIMTLGKFMYFNRDFGLIDFDVKSSERAQQLLQIEQNKYEKKRKIEIQSPEKTKEIERKKSEIQHLEVKFKDEEIQQYNKIQIRNKEQEKQLIDSEKNGEQGSNLTNKNNEFENQLEDENNSSQQKNLEGKQDESLSQSNNEHFQQDKKSNLKIQNKNQDSQKKSLSQNNQIFITNHFQSQNQQVDQGNEKEQTIQKVEQKNQKIKKKKNSQKNQLSYRQSKLLTKFVLVELFKKNSTNNRDITLNELEQTLMRIGEYIFLKKLVQIHGFKKIKDVQEDQLNQLKNSCHEMVFHLIDLHDINKYRKRMKLVRKAFNMKDDFERVKLDELKYKFQLFNPNESNQEVLRAELEKRKEEKNKLKQLEKEKRELFKFQQLLKFHNALKLEEMFPEKRDLIHKIVKLSKQEKEKLKLKMKEKTAFLPIKQDFQPQEVEEQDQQLTWESVKKITYKDLKNDYKPLALLSQIVSSSDFQDDIYLAEYQIQKDDLVQGKIRGQGKQQIIQTEKDKSTVIGSDKFPKAGNPPPIIQQNGSYSVVHRRINQRSQSMRREDHEKEKRKQIRESYGNLDERLTSMEPNDINVIEQINKKRSISNNQPLTPYNNDYQFAVSHGGQGTYPMNIQSGEQELKSYQQKQQTIPYSNGQYLQGQNQNHLKKKVIFIIKYQVKIIISPQKQFVNISQNTLARAKKLEFEQLQKEKQLLSQMVQQQNNKIERLQLKRSGYY